MPPIAITNLHETDTHLPCTTDRACPQGTIYYGVQIVSYKGQAIKGNMGKRLGVQSLFLR